MIRLYYGTHYFFPCAFEINPQENTDQVDDAPIEDFIESLRPQNKLSRKESVLLSDDADFVEQVTDCIDAIYMVDVKDAEKSDLAWYNYAKIMLKENKIKDAELAALNYWAGVPFSHVRLQCAEYRSKSATVVAMIELNVDIGELTQVV